MFRHQSGPSRPTILLITIGLLIAVALTTAAMIWMAVEVSREQIKIEQIVEEQPEAAVDHLRQWRNERQREFTSIIIDILVLGATVLALALVARAYFASQKSLHEVRTMASDILASIDQAVLTANTEGRITNINPVARDLLSIDDSAVGQLVEEAVEGSVPLMHVFETVMESGKSIYDQDVSVMRNGHKTRLRAEGHLMRDTDDSVIGVVIFIRDVTEQHLIGSQMKRMERFMGLGTLAAGLHHEIKNPLSALSLHVQLLEERLEDIQDQDIRENISVLKTETTRINGVLESFRDFASLDTLNRSETDLFELVKQTADLMRPKAAQQGVLLSTELPDRRPPCISADGARLEQVLLNLVINSLDAMRQGGTLRLKLHSDNGALKIDVSDTGTGIPDNIRQRIFDPYFTTKTDGSGMGLAVCDKVVQQHHGQISVQTSSAGTVFQIALPLDEA